MFENADFLPKNIKGAGMSRQGGYREGSGRPKGAKNKRTIAIETRLQELDCDPFEGMARIARKAEEEGELSTAGRMYAELGRYLAPQYKASDPEENTKPRDWATLEEVQAMKSALLSGRHPLVPDMEKKWGA